MQRHAPSSARGGPRTLGAGEPPACTLSLSLLGRFELCQDGRRLDVPLSSQRLVAFLGLNRRRVARIYVAGHLWTDSSEERAAAALRTALWRLGGPRGELVRCEGTSLLLNPAVAVDIDDAARIAREVLDGSDTAAVRRSLARLRDGELLPDWYDDWVLIERERFRQLRLHALEQLCLQLSAAGRHAEATDAGIAAVAGEPLRESAHRALIAAHLAEGNACEALRQFDACCALLRRHLDVAPSAALTTLVAHVDDAARGRAVTSR